MSKELSGEVDGFKLPDKIIVPAIDKGYLKPIILYKKHTPNGGVYYAGNLTLSLYDAIRRAKAL